MHKEVSEVMKVTKMPKDVAEKTIAETPKRVIGQWTELLTDLAKTGQGAKIEGLTRGQVAALIRQAKVAKFSAVACDKYTAVIVSPPSAKKPA